MQVPSTLKGEIVAIQVKRPLYLFQYGGHVKWEGVERALPLARTVKHDGAAAPVAVDLLQLALVQDVLPDAVVLRLMQPHDEGSRRGVHVTVVLPTEDIAQIVQLTDFDGLIPEPVVKTRTPQIL